MALQTEGSRTNDIVVLSIAGRVDGDTAPELDQACRQWLAPTDRTFILVFTEVSYISSAGLSSVLKAGKGIGRQGGRLLICGLNSHLKRLFIFAGFDALFPLLDTREAAMQAAQSESANGSPIRP
jgi:anti-anti-sigma factor